MWKIFRISWNCTPIIKLRTFNQSSTCTMWKEDNKANVGNSERHMEMASEGSQVQTLREREREMTRTPSLHTNKGHRCKERGGCESCNKIILYHLTIENLMRPEKKQKKGTTKWPITEVKTHMLKVNCLEFFCRRDFGQEILIEFSLWYLYSLFTVLNLIPYAHNKIEGWFLIKCLQIATCLWCSTDRISYGNCNLLLKFENYLMRPFNLRYWDMGHGCSDSFAIC